MKILGIDPGLNHLGYACVEKSQQRFKVLTWGTISPPPTLSLPQKLALIFESLKNIINKISPDYLALEEVYTRGVGNATLKLSQAQALVLLLCGLYNLRFKTFAPKEIKKFLTQNGNAEKQDMVSQIQWLIKHGVLSFVEDFEEDGLDSHKVDALAVALLLGFELGG
ncbi:MULTISPECIES: crossover junction endodeoxyribonuclease RuvC [Thermodesulfobacterium]|jgi:crossover junction endodeoxyribonuclease RuvC|uniref:Uncharacterized protein n=1 Tax=Thermodesulfobacterium commune TaxID=1741 RepID=A0A124FKS4_9BACT|nr:crossover junction endodeoxyribonuclease RuvC [Thermodesulfobacterium sp.]KUJ97236.1 MAG: Crossover junction endodeoxyribonuclease RuvC [Thermodesulfobacterium sp. 37_54]KUK18941.1 MAG: Crossover junction endodeoxyribonuclease RuvC [Thermodesulfobacterium commune]KUK38140.1 MAG: Crossover junction endodeoxyribonuclease RuvC [Thermodesulfobacterium commune]MBZ4681506.1 hypothetical protein [Thermodesulfobacterium sp.]MDK2861869.1 crossover junction endodeoxyribonuclease RuvC [Thermodesulfoba